LKPIEITILVVAVAAAGWWIAVAVDCDRRNGTLVRTLFGGVVCVEPVR